MTSRKYNGGLAHMSFFSRRMAEFINLSPKSDKIVPYFGHLFSDEPLPKNGFIDLPDRPGFGVTLNKKGLRRPYTRKLEHSVAQYKANATRASPTVARMPF